MKSLTHLADSTISNSLAVKFRRRRFKLFYELINKLPRPIKILDVGGTLYFWEAVGFVHEDGVEITLFNLFPQEIKHRNFKFVQGDATDLSLFANKSFDVVFSNSVIEHLTTFENQKKMADEIKRVGKRYWVQTPNFYFPIEQHFLCPFYHWLPIRTRIWLIQNFNLGWYKREQDYKVAYELVTSIRLLKYKEIKTLFPEAKIYKERFLGLVKSYIAYSGL
jgi:ubiquinone/menaquinone biosynthesis C-methylase UbiE